MVFFRFFEFFLKNSVFLKKLKKNIGYKTVKKSVKV